jgi:hypothetical protein
VARSRAQVRNREIWWLKPEIEKLAVVEQEDRRIIDAWEEPIRDWLMRQPGSEPTVSQILRKALLKQPENWTRADATRVGQCMRAIGGKKVRVRPRASANIDTYLKGARHHARRVSTGSYLGSHLRRARSPIGSKRVIRVVPGTHSRVRASCSEHINGNPVCPYGVTRVRLSAGTAGPDAGDRGARRPRLPRRGRHIWAEPYTPHAERGQIIRPLVKSSTHEAARMLESACATASDEAERYHPTGHRLRACPGSTHGPWGASKSFDRPYRDRVSSHNLLLW